IYNYHDDAAFPSFPTRRSSDLHLPALADGHQRTACHQLAEQQQPLFRIGLGAQQLIELLEANQSVIRLQQHFMVERVHTTEVIRSEEHTSELQSRENLVCRLLL